MKTATNISTKDRMTFQTFLLIEKFFGFIFFNQIALFKKKFLDDLLKKLSLTPPAKVLIDSRENLSASQFKNEYVKNSTPVIFKAAARNWKCCQNWNLDYLQQHYGKNDLLLVNANGLTERDDRSTYEILTLEELILNIKTGGKKYLRFSPLLENNRPLVQEMDTNWIQTMKGKNTFASTCYAFIGGASTKTLLHTDQPCNLSLQVYGKKKWTLFSSRDSLFLYPEIPNTAYVKSPVDVDAPNNEKYPLFKFATPYIAFLEAGDILYIPPHTWHFVENFTDSISVAFRYSSLYLSLRSSILFTFLRLFSVNPPLWKTIEYGKVDTNLIWAHSNGKIKEVLRALKIRSKREN